MRLAGPARARGLESEEPMPKQKTKKSLTKRVKITARGKALHKKAGRAHLLASKRSGRKRKLRRPGLLSKSDMAKVRRMSGHG